MKTIVKYSVIIAIYSLNAIALMSVAEIFGTTNTGIAFIIALLISVFIGGLIEIIYSLKK